MGNDGQERVDGDGESQAPRSIEKIVLRDYDRIQERTPFQLKPIHLKLAAAGGVIVVVLAVFAGWLIGRGDREPDRPAHPVTTAAPVVISPEPSGAPAGTATPPKTEDGRRNVRGSILPLPSPEPRPAVEPSAERRSAVEIIEPPPPPPPPPPPEFVDWTFWPGLLVTTCGWSCVSQDGDCRPEDLPKPEPPPPPPAPPPEPEPVPAVAETVPAVAEQAQAVAKPAPAASEPKPSAIEPDKAPQAKPKVVAEPGPKAAVQPAVKTPKPAEPAPRKFAVQIRSFKDEPAAKEFADQIRAKGYNPFIVTYTDAGGTSWYRVRTGSFGTAADAAAFAADLNAKEAEQAIPVEVK